MMEFSFLSTHESSICFGDKSQSLCQSFEADSPFSEYSNIVEYKPNSNINEICDEFREITKIASEQNSYLTMIKNYIDNLSRYFDCLTYNAQLLPQNNESDLQTICCLVINEIKTWKLMFQLYEDRFNHMSSEATSGIARTSELDLLRDLYENNSNLRESQIVVDWLEDCMKENLDKNFGHLMGTDGKAWEHTKHTIRKKNNFTSVGNCLLSELDPDAPLRGKLNLTDSDKNDENEYLRYIFHCLQCGDIEKAQSICQSHDEWWRALSLDGWKPFHNALLKDNHNLSNIDVTGNSNRDTFKSVCYQLSEDTQLNVFERAIYAMLCGNISVLSLVQKDWSGLMWAYFKSYTEHVVDDYLKTFTVNGHFRTQSLFGDDDLDLESMGLVRKKPSHESLVHWTRERLFDDIAAKLVHDAPIDVLKTGTRPGAKTHVAFYRSVFEVVQQFVIVDDIEGLVHYIDVALSKLSRKKSPADKLLLRFLAHVVIFIFSIHVDMQMDVYHRVLEQYIECLIDDRRINSIAFYVSKLSTDLQIKWYCKSMTGVTDANSRRQCIFEALEYDLPIIEISRLVVQSIRTTAGPISSYDLGVYSLAASGQAGMDTGLVTDNDKARISGLDWLAVVPDQYYDLVRQTNALSRQFLDQDKMKAAKMALDKTTKEIVCKVKTALSSGADGLPRWLPNALYENDCLKAFVDAYDAYIDWHNHSSTKRPEMKDFNVTQDANKLSFHEKQMLQKEYEDYHHAMQQWEKSAQYYGDRAVDSILATLRMGERGWLSEVCEESVWVDEEEVEQEGVRLAKDSDDWSNRLQQMERLQRKGVVNLCFLLMKVAVGTERKERCFEVTDLLADERLALYEHFEKTQLHRLLQQVRQCSLALMADGGDLFGIQS